VGLVLTTNEIVGEWGVALLCAVNVELWMLDSRTYWMVGGRLSRQRAGTGGRVAMMLLYWVLLIVPPILLVPSIQTAWRERMEERRARLAWLAADIARLERELRVGGAEGEIPTPQP
jgi:hypothetical protein